ncbi:hypothetical protein AAHA92_07359 [Salvia divinorum]|uniref:Uncharacterized protein n=1 Tax=Salvia divinorum TaxID=28513 RepID=A0ABD1IBB9_SALDI
MSKIPCFALALKTHWTSHNFISPSPLLAAHNPGNSYNKLVQQIVSSLNRSQICSLWETLADQIPIGTCHRWLKIPKMEKELVASRRQIGLDAAGLLGRKRSYF